MSEGLRFRILGPLEVERDGRLVHVGGPKLRALTAYLAFRAGQAVSFDALIDVLWAESPPESVRTSLQVLASKCRKLLALEGGGATLETRGSGYALLIDPERVDLFGFERLVEDGLAAIAAGQPERGRASLHGALELWRGEPLEGVELPGLETVELTRFLQLHLAAETGLAEGELSLGRHLEAIPALERLRADDPMDERVAQMAALALYRAGRQAEALEALARLRRTLSEKLGLEPGPAAVRLERLILARDPSLELVRRNEEPDVPIRRGRKLVTALVCRFTLGAGRPADPEAMRAGLSALSDRARGVVEGLGGEVREALGPRFVAIFGVPKVHEDDAYRATVAASEVRDLAASSGNGDLDRAVQVRIGVSSSEVLVETSGDLQELLTADPIDVAERLASAARPGEVLIARPTLRLAGASVGAEPTEVVLVGEAQQGTSAFRLERVAKHGKPRRPHARLIGRQEELDVLRRAFTRVARERKPALVTILGAAGVGKSKLVSAFVEELENARVFLGRCLSYGRDITFWPIAEMVKQAADVTEDDTSRVARRKVAAVLKGDPEAAFVGRQIAGVMGLTDETPVPDEIFWAIRRFLGSAARDLPLVLVVDDLHWADQTLLDLIEHLAAWSRDVPMLVACLARPELLDQRPGWAAGLEATTLVLGPLGPAESSALLDDLLGKARLEDRGRERIMSAAEGHPLFLVELVSMLIDDGLVDLREGRWSVVSDLSTVPIPPTVQALLEARLDRLSPREREILECAAVVGKEFGPEEVAELVEEAEDDVRDALSALVRRDLVVPDTVSPGSRRYRFRHVLLREVVYAGIPKERRSRDHEVFAESLERRAGRRLAEIEEIVGYHYEAAHRYRRELGLPDDLHPPLRVRAARRLTSAGRRAVARGDVPAAASLLGRADALLEDDDPALPETAWLCSSALFDAGSFDAAIEVAERGLAAAERAGDDAMAWRLRIERVDVLSVMWPDEHPSRELEEVGSAAIREFERAGDAAGLARAHRLLGDALSARGRQEEAVEHFLAGRRYARSVGDEREAGERASFGLTHGPIRAERAIEIIREDLMASGQPRPEPLAHLGFLEAMTGRFEEAEATLREGYERFREIGGAPRAASFAMYWADARLIADDPVGAESVIRPALGSLERMRERYLLSTAAAALGEALYRQGRLDEAMAASIESAEATGEDDVASQMMWRQVRAKVLAARGEFEEAERLAREAAALAEGSDFLQMSGDAHADLGTVLATAGKTKEAAEAFEEAQRLYERKGSVVSARRAAEALEGLRATRS